MKKRKPDPRQIALDLGQGPGFGLPAEPAARVDSDWDSLQEHAPQKHETPDQAAPSARNPLEPIARNPLEPIARNPLEPIARNPGWPAVPDAWEEPLDLCPVIPPTPDEPPLEVALPEGPARFVLPASIAWSGRRPFSHVAGRLQPGDPVRLVRECDNPHDPHAIRIVNLAGEAAGYVYADTASWLSLLFDLAPPEGDESVVTGFAGHHVYFEIRLRLQAAWPLFTIIAVFGLRSEHFSKAFNLPDNPFLQPLAELSRRYLANYDYFTMPPAIVSAYADLRQRFEATGPAPSP